MKLSVLMTVYNGGCFLAPALDSILNQTFRDFEFIIVNDGSTDGTRECLEVYAQKDARICLLHQEKNQGLTAALNLGLSQAQGRYLARMDADDISMPERFERQLDWLETHPDCGVLGTAYRIMDACGTTQLDCHFANEHHFLLWYLCFQNPLAHPTVMLRTELLREAGGYREEARYSEDFDLWWRLATVTEIGFLPEVLVSLRRHSGCVSLVRAQEQIQMRNRVLGSMLPNIGAGHLSPLLAPPVTPAKQRQFIGELLKCFENRKGITPSAWELIRQDAALRLAWLALRYPFQAGGALREGLALAPGLVGRVVKDGFKRLLTRSACNPIRK